MNIIIQSQKTNRIYLLSKGADQIINNFIDFENQIFVEEKSGELSREGLRTLAFCYKEISQQQFNEFNRDYQDQAKNLKTMKQKQQQIFEQLEQNQIFLGITGIEDELQDNIKTTISTLREAEIKVWMLTGDKLETSKCIAISTDIKKKDQEFFLLEFQNQNKFLHLLNKIDYQKHCLIIQGDCLAKVHEDYLLLEKFLEKALLCSSVIVCRCDPWQKSMITRMIKNTNKIVCSIGDGGNDVGMILESNIGIGIEGLEGKQAALASDVSIYSFGDIQKLILYHGHLSFYRTSSMVSFVMSRGALIFFIQVLFMLTYEYIPIFLYNGYLTLFYSTVFTNLPVFSLIFDIDLTQIQMYNYPVLYAVVQQYFGLTSKNFCINILKSLYQGFVIYTLSLFLIESYLTKIVTCSFTALIFIQMLNVYTKIKSFNYFIYFSIILSLLIYLYSLLYLKSFFMLSQMGKYDALIVLFTVLVAWFPFQAYKWLWYLLFPNFIDKIISESKIAWMRTNNFQNINFK